MRIHTRAVLIIATIASLATVVPVAAQDGGPPPCEGESVSGTVVAVDEGTGVVTVDTGAGLCTVALDGGYDHPIVAVLGSYFGDVSVEDLAEALEATQGCVVQDGASWAWADCGEGTTPVTVVGDNGDGTFVVTLEDGTEVVISIEDPATAESLSEALQMLAVEWALSEDGTVVQPGSQIASYHEEGMGFGVLVKLYAMAAESAEACVGAEEPCGVTVQELVEAFKSGVGMGQLFKEYGKPSILGIGHVKDKDKKPEHAGPKDKDEGNGPPEHAGPKDKDKGNGPPEHAGPKAKDESGKPMQAGSKKDKNKKK